MFRSVCLRLSFCLSLSLSVSVCLSLCLSLCLCLTVFLSLALLISVCVCLTDCLSLCVSLFVCQYLSVCLSFFPPPPSLRSLFGFSRVLVQWRLNNVTLPWRRNSVTLPCVLSAGCLYKGQVYVQGQRWDDGCDLSCECDDASTGRYRCRARYVDSSVS